jgi:hypothetical protein
MLRPGNPMFVILPNESNEAIYHQGKVIESDAQMFVAKFDKLQPLEPRSEIYAYGEVDGKFFQQKAIVEETFLMEPYPILKFRRIGAASPSEKRCSFRVKTTNMNIIGRIGWDTDCPVTDVSLEGFGAITTTELEVGSLVDISIKYDSQVLEGEVRVQSTSILSNDRYRCGMMIPERNGKMRRSLEKIASSIQRLQLRTNADFKAFDAEAEVNGEIIFSIIDASGEFREMILDLLEKNGISNLQREEWYKQQAWLNTLTAVTERMGPDVLFNIGLRVPDNGQYPPGIDSLDNALKLLDFAYHMNHRNGDVGQQKFKILGERTFEVICQTPYPCDFDRGIFVTLCNRFRPKGSKVFASVEHDDSKPCRKQGAKSCTYLISW